MVNLIIIKVAQETFIPEKMAQEVLLQERQSSEFAPQGLMQNLNNHFLGVCQARFIRRAGFVIM